MRREVICRPGRVRRRGHAKVEFRPTFRRRPAHAVCLVMSATVSSSQVHRATARQILVPIAIGKSRIAVRPRRPLGCTPRSAANRERARSWRCAPERPQLQRRVHLRPGCDGLSRSCWTPSPRVASASATGSSVVLAAGFSLRPSSNTSPGSVEIRPVSMRHIVVALAMCARQHDHSAARARAG